MKTKKMPKIYFGEGGFSGASEIRRGGNARQSACPQKRSMVYGLGGVSSRAVLASGGIARGGMVRVRSGERVVAVKPSVKPKVEAVIPKKDECVPPKEERGNGMKPDEKRLADFLEAVQEVKPKCEEAEKIAWRLRGVHATTTDKIAAEEIKNIEADSIGDEGIGERKVREAMMKMAKETRAVLPELPLGEEFGRRKKKRRRHGKHRREEEFEVAGQSVSESFGV